MLKYWYWYTFRLYYNLFLTLLQQLLNILKVLHINISLLSKRTSSAANNGLVFKLEIYHKLHLIVDKNFFDLLWTDATHISNKFLQYTQAVSYFLNLYISRFAETLLWTVFIVYDVISSFWRPERLEWLVLVLLSLNSVNQIANICLDRA